MPAPKLASVLTGRGFAAVATIPVFYSILFCGCMKSTTRISPSTIDGADWDAAMQYEPGRKAKARNAIDTARLNSIARSYLGTRYRHGGMSKKGLDCTGLVCLVFHALDGTVLPHSSKEMVKVGKKIPLSRVRPGDLLFFRSGFRRRVGHVGIYLGDSRFIHASSKFGVIESTIQNNYYRSHFIQTRRLFP